MAPLGFRAWDKKVCRILRPAFLFMNLGDGELNNIKEDFISDPLLPHEVIMMQSTGLKDKNGKEIFEGDILRIIWFNGREEIREVGDIRYEWNTNATIFDACYGYSGNICEVIGNIYENPDLLPKAA